MDKRSLMLKPLYCGVCFTDNHLYLGLGGTVAEGDTPRSVAQMVTGTFPSKKPFNEISKEVPLIILGHEASAEVVEIGSEVKGWKVGDRAAIDPCYHCGECVGCKAGLQCNVTHAFAVTDAEYTAIDALSCFKLPPEVSDIAGANIESFSVATRGVRRIFTIGDNVALFGADDYNIAVLQWVRSRANKVVIVDPIKIRRDLAKKLGADLTIDPTSTNVAEAVREVMPFGADCVFVTEENYIKSSLKYIAQAFEVSRVQGRIMLLRMYSDEVLHNVKINVPYLKEVSLSWSGCYGSEPWRGGRDRGDFQITIDAIAEKKIDAEVHVSKIVPFEKIKTKEDIDDIFNGYPEKETKTLIKM
ncbi:MAG: alcohol dehydrogenase catalytic domain-containing protein [Actinomycetota bacterium]